MEILGSSIDDAVGEAFDKTARLLGLDYPGGPELDKLAQTGSENKLYKFPISNVEGFKFSFSGLKTAVLRLKEKIGEEKFTEDKADIAFAFQNCTKKSIKPLLKRI
jgi:N6-L-threonylcarbamoyladenine synthase